MDTTGCFAEDIRCGFIGYGLSDINLSMAMREGFSMGVVSPEICSFSGMELKFGHNPLNNLNTYYSTLKCLSMIRC